MVDNFVYSSDFVFKPFQPREEEGDSGALWLATSKSDASVRYVIKTDPCGLACNEFMYHKVAAAVGLFTSEVKLMLNANQPVSAGIRYIPSARKYEHDASDPANNRLFYSFLTLYVILNEDDSQEFYSDEQGRLLKLDNVSSFNISYVVTLAMGHSNPAMVAAVDHMLRSGLAFIEYDKYEINYDSLCKRYGEVAGQTCLNFTAKFAALDESLLHEAYDAIEEAYSRQLSDYYRAFISSRKAVCKQFYQEMTSSSQG